MDYLSRYQNGEQVAVWQELIALGEAIREEPLYSQAEAVVRETMRRVKHNVEILIERLKTLDYKFVEYTEPLIATSPQVLKDMTSLEQKIGFIPLSLRIFLEEVGRVNLMGSHPKLSEYVDGDTPYNFDVYSDPLVVECSIIEYGSDPTLFILEEYEDDGETPAVLYTLEFAPDPVHKANYSGGSPSEIRFPDPAIDAKIIGDVDYGYFVEYLRDCFRWGGFPGWNRSKQPPMAEIDFLKKDLLPI